ncbi:hypothetical protein SAMN04488123_1275 [Natribacillus halophilus]|uniref:Uncharacterized protein n=1 Tax=Natribacillus halophilus TaxID=549003 RepID=A0A1G8SEZ7_9BACI|nr:hypothetical protein SAMN04488123_1275 [Natribacillus halophilus]
MQITAFLCMDWEIYMDLYLLTMVRFPFLEYNKGSVNL